MKKILNFIKSHSTILELTLLIILISFFIVNTKIRIEKIIIILLLITIIYIVFRFGDDIMKKIKRDTKEIKFTKDDMNDLKKGKTTSTRVSKKKKKRKLNTILFILLILAGIGMLLFLAGALYIVVTAPKFDVNQLYTKEKSVIYDSENNVIAELGTEKRDKATYDELPQVLIDAILATEDSNFFNHKGIDLGRFTVATIKQLMGKDGGGASTISMQVIKNQFTGKQQTLTRKFQDIYLAVFKLEKQYTKEEILEFYVNIPYLGNGSYGVKQAAMSYFGKDVSDLTLPEAAMIAGMFQAPGTYDPTIYPENTKERRSTVLYLMEKHGYITKEEREAAENVTIEEMLKTGMTVQTKHQGYVDVVVSEIEEKTGESPYNTSMEIYTALEEDKQSYVEKVLSGEAGYTFDNDVIQSGVSVVDVNTGAVVAIGAGRNKQGEKTYNFATMIKRQIGSTAKPLFDYGPAIEYNDWWEGKTIVDGPYSYSDGKPIKNVDNSYLGTITIRDALSKSRNIPALKTFQQVDNAKIKEFVTNLGITPEIDANGRLHEAHSLGAFNGASPLELSAAYAAFANGGYYIEPYTVTKVVFNRTGEEKNFSPTKKRAMSDSTAFMIADILSYGVEVGNVDVDKINGINFAAKTGTTNFDDETIKKYGLSKSAINDLWTVGFDQEYSFAVWLGYEHIDKAHYNTTSNWSDRRQLFRALATGIFEKTGKDFEAPSSVVKVGYRYSGGEICLANEGDTGAIYDWFKVGTEPTNACSGSTVEIPNVSDLSIKSNGNGNLVLSWKTPTMADTYGLPTYIIYEDEGGNLTEIGSTDANSYRITVSDNRQYTFVVKVSYSNADGLSSGVSANIDLSDNESSKPSGEETQKEIRISLNGGKEVKLNVGSTWSDPGLIITENGVDVTSKYSWTPSGIKDGEVVNTPGTYTNTYTVQVNGKTFEVTRTIIAEGSSTTPPETDDNTPTSPDQEISGT